MKLQLWEFQMKERNFVHPPTLCGHQPIDSSCYADFISDLKEQFVCRFADINKHLKKCSYSSLMYLILTFMMPQKSYKWNRSNFKVRVSSKSNFRMSIY